MLIKCPECGREVSDMAQSCPNCGLPASKFSTILIKKEAEMDADTVYTTTPQAEYIVGEDNKCSKRSNKRFVIISIFTAIIVLAIIVFSGINYSKNNNGIGMSYENHVKTNSTYASDINPARHDDTEVWTCAMDAVKRELKAPSTAKFCKYTEAVITDLGNGKHQVEGWVDAENSYGATLRQNFIVTYTATEKGYKDPNVIFW